MSGHLQAGVGRSDITPAAGVPQGGWGAQTHQRGTAADMPFYATALVVADGNQQIAIVDVDAIGFDMEWTAKILDAIVGLSGIPRERVRFSCTHTHSGPNTFRLANISEGLEMVRSYLESLPQRIAGAVWQALRNLQPVRCAAGEGISEISVNRRFAVPGGGMAVGRNWAGAVDPTVRVVRFDSLDERPVATIVHYSCHPTTMAWQNELFTPDYPGVVRQVVEREVGGTCLFLQGAPADITPRRGFTGDTQVYRWLGTRLGLEAAKVALGLETLPKRELYTGLLQSGAVIALYEDRPVEPPAPELSVLTRQIQMPIRNFAPLEALEEEERDARANMQRMRAHGTWEELSLATAKATQAGWRAANARLYQGKLTTDWEMQAIRIGEIALLSMRGEPFNEISRRIVAASPFAHTLVSGYSNGGFGYIPTPEAYTEGGYEVEATPFAPEAAGVVVDDGVRLLRELEAEGSAAEILH